MANNKLLALANTKGLLACSDGKLGIEFLPLFKNKRDANKFIKYSTIKSEYKLTEVEIKKYENNRVKKQQHKKA